MENVVGVIFLDRSGDLAAILLGALAYWARYIRWSMSCSASKNTALRDLVVPVANQVAALKSSQFKVPTSWSRDRKSVG
jgi:hypothetical protein